MIFKPIKIISGGQTGVDLGGLVGAKRVGIKTGGVVPRGYRTEAGEQSKVLIEFGLSEHQSSDYKLRTEDNVIAFDATLIIAKDVKSNSTRLTIKYCEKHKKPFLVVKLSLDCVIETQSFIEETRPRVLNVTGNRESVSKGIASKAAAIIEALFS